MGVWAALAWMAGMDSSCEPGHAGGLGRVGWCAQRVGLWAWRGPSWGGAPRTALWGQDASPEQQRWAAEGDV